MPGIEAFSRWESNVRSYYRDIDVVFERASGHFLIDENGRTYIDFLAGAGALNYGHNHPELRASIVAYLQSDGITHSLDLYTDAKRTFIQDFQEGVLEPRQLDYRMQFTGPTGTNAVEAALKLARQVTSRWNVAAFTNGFHGMTLGSLSATGSRHKRAGAALPSIAIDRLPFDGYLGTGIDTLDYVEALLEDTGSGFDPPAAFIVETLQAEGGLIEASVGWLRRLQAIAHKYGSLLIIDEIQTGCGRTGPFFSFERAGLKPDIVCLSKSIGGFGLPLAVVLMKPEFDVWEPGQHNGTFRGNNLAFVAGASALRIWQGQGFQESVDRKGKILRNRLDAIFAESGRSGEVRGLGMLQGIAWDDFDLARRVAEAALVSGVVVETCGAHSHVLKIMPPLTITEDALVEGLDKVAAAVRHAVGLRSVPSGFLTGAITQPAAAAPL